MNLFVTIFKFYFSIFKTMFFPYYILLAIFTELKNFFLFYVKLFQICVQDHLNFLLFPFISLRDHIYEIFQFTIGRTYYYSKEMIKLTLICFIFMFNSIIITIICLYFTSIPKRVDKNLTFSFVQDKILYSKQNVNCKEDNCIYDLIVNNDYKIYLELDILRNEGSFNQGNFETEFQIINEKKEIKSVKIVSFLGRNDQLTENTKNIVLLPLKVLGAFNQDHVTITFHENLSFNFNMKKIKIFIKSTLLKIGQARLIFQPIIGWARLYFHYSMLFTIPMMTTCCFFIQFFLYLIKKVLSKYYLNKENTFEGDD